MKKNILLVLFLFIVLSINVYLVPILWSTSSATYVVDNALIADVTPEQPEIDTSEIINSLKEQYSNDDVVGYMTIDNTDYSTVITQAEDNNKYVRKDAYGNYERGGTPFLDYRVDLSNSKKLLIFGHNSAYRDMPFKILENYYDENYYKEHQYITFTSEYGTKKYQIFSVYVETSDFDYYDMGYTSGTKWLNHITKFKNNSMYDTGVDIDEDDNILILQTCSTLKEYSKYEHKFLVIFAKEV